MTTMLAELDNEVMTVDEVLPPAGKLVIVQCDGFRCVGFCDQNGQWADAYDHHGLPEILWFKPLGPSAL